LEKLLKYINGNLSKGVLPLVILDSIYCLGSFSVVVGAKKSWSDVTLAAAVSILWLSLLSIPVLEVRETLDLCQVHLNTKLHNCLLFVYRLPNCP